MDIVVIVYLPLHYALHGDIIHVMRNGPNALLGVVIFNDSLEGILKDIFINSILQFGIVNCILVLVHKITLSICFVLK